MADHSKPTTASTYANYTAELDARMDDLAVGLDPAVVTVTNPPVDAIRWTSASNKWQKWSGSAWVDLTSGYAIPIVGGTINDTVIGGTTPAAATVTTLTVNGTATLGDADTDSHAVNGSVEHTANSSAAALRVTQLGSGKALVVRDEAADATVFEVDAAGLVGVGCSANATTAQRVEGSGTRGVHAAGNILSAEWIGFFASASYQAATASGSMRMFGTYAMSQAGADVTTLTHFDASASTADWAAANADTVIGFSAGAFTKGDVVYGFLGQVGNVAGRWNFYASGLAPNYFAGDVRSGTGFSAKAVVTNSNASVTVTAATLLGGVRTGTPAANITYTLPTGTNMDALFTSLQTDQAFEWSVINLAGATYTITVAGNTDHSVVGGMVVQPATSARFLSRKTSANTFVTYRIS